MSITDLEDAKSRLVKCTGHAHFRHRCILSLLSRRPVRFDEIRSYDEEPGLRDYEVSFLRLCERISNGTTVEISYTGTSVLFSPGALQGGNHIHQCPLSKSIGWFLEPLLAIAPFCKKQLVLTLKGITTDEKNASVDILRLSCLPHLALFLPTPDHLELKITKRGHAPLGGGEVTFRCPTVKRLKPGFDFTSPGQIQKIRGIAHSVRVSPQFSARLVSAARGVLNRYIPDIYIYTDQYRGEESGKSPGYALTLLASSTTTVLYSAEGTSTQQGQDVTPEDVGTEAARMLVEAIARGGCIDQGCEALVTTLMTAGTESDVVRCFVGGTPDAFLVQHLRDLRDFMRTSFKVKQVEATESRGEGFVLSCVGTGFINTAAKTT